MEIDRKIYNDSMNFLNRVWQSASINAKRRKTSLKVKLIAAVKGTSTSPFRLVRYSHFSTCYGSIKSKAFAGEGHSAMRRVFASK